MANFYTLNTRVMNETTTTGTGVITIAGTVDGYLSMVNASFGSDAVFPYVMEGTSGACIGQVECGYGQFIAGDFVRDYGSSAYGIVAGDMVPGAVDFLAGTKRIYLTPLREELWAARAVAHAFNNSLRYAVGVEGTNTTNATPTVLVGFFATGDPCFDAADNLGATFAFPAAYSGAFTFNITVMANEELSDEGAAWQLIFLVSFAAGTPVLVGSPVPTLIAASAGAAAWDLDIGVSGNDVTLTATGAAATTIYWTAAGFAVGNKSA